MKKVNREEKEHNNLTQKDNIFDSRKQCSNARSLDKYRIPSQFARGQNNRDQTKYQFLDEKMGHQDNSRMKHLKNTYGRHVEYPDSREWFHN